MSMASKFVIRFIILMIATSSTFAMVSIVDSAAASAAPNPPPAECGSYPTYAYQDQNCWGNNGFPPAGCVTNSSITGTADSACEAWINTLPPEGQPTWNAAANSCATNQDPTTGTTCCPAGDTDCERNSGSTSGQTATPPSSSLDAKTKAVCDELFNDLQSTAGGAENGPFANLYVSSGCTGTTTQDTACGSLITLGSYADTDGNSDGATSTGLSPADAKALGAKITAALKTDGCSKAPSTTTLSTTTAHVKGLIDGLEYYALIVCVGVIFVSSALWALGSKGQNPGQELTGKRGIIVAITCALLIGGIPAIMSFVNNESKKPGLDEVGVLTAGFPSTGSAAGCSGIGATGKSSC